MPEASLLRFLLIPLPVLVLIAGCTPNQMIGEYRDTNPPVSPVAINMLPDDIEEVTLTVADGQFGVDDMFLLEGAPTLMHVANDDARAYRFQIEEALVTLTEIPANAVTDVPFTTPNAGEFEGQLLEMDSADVLDTVRVVVRSAGGVLP